MSTEPTGIQADAITIGDFAKIKLRVGHVTEAHNHPNADKLIVLTVDLGNETRQICAGLRGHYEAEDLVDKNIIVVVNLAPRMMRGLESQGMLLAASSSDRSQIVFLSPESKIEPGAAIS